MKILSVINGTIKQLENVDDEAFSQKMMGDGIAITPTDGLVVSPCDGKVKMIFPTQHAIGIESNDGVEILIHIGIDTVNMNGDGFIGLIQQGEEVCCGEPVIQFDIDKVNDAGYPIDVMVIVTNMANHKNIKKTSASNVKTGDELLVLE
ncbi:MAG: PTS glucose transporter subunit IIA [Thomasclavelia sp.]|jgi:PTS system glucose-specific IIA component|nr:PTS glucose transporter subunit IIA [Thomasclavelia sp.]